MLSPTKLLLPLLALCAAASTATAAVAPRAPSTSFSGANSFFVIGLPKEERLAILQGMADADMSVLRIFIQGFDANVKESGNVAVPDVEPVTLGQWDDTILERIDEFMLEAHEYGVKLLLALYDKNTLNAGGPYNATYGVEGFYTDASARLDFNRRIAHILSGHKHSTLGKPYSELGSYIFGWDVMNEPMIGDAALFNENLDWVCETAAQIRANVADPNQLIFSGGNSAAESVQDLFFNQTACAGLDVVEIHDYTGAFRDYLPAAIAQAQASGKKIVVGEWGSLYGSENRTANLVWNAGMLEGQVPWLYWQMVSGEDPHQLEDYEITVGGEDWETLKALSQAAVAAGSVFDFSASLAL